jgi:hypothetical protein
VSFWDTAREKAIPPFMVPNRDWKHRKGMEASEAFPNLPEQ